MGFNIAKRINKIYRLLLILLIISLSLTGCAWNDLLGQDTSEGFEKGFEYDESWKLHHKGTYPPEIDNLFYCACKGDKSEFNINFVILDFFYGGDFDDVYHWRQGAQRQAVPGLCGKNRKKGLL